MPPNVISAMIGVAERAEQKMPIQRILLIVAVLVSWLGPLASGHAVAPDRPDSLNLGAALSEPCEVRIGVKVHQDPEMTFD